ncbi:Response regulator receiver domain-containing protein [Parafrankia irregularis]|uniref:Response regulator receiver domain-containing protein n=1 Tax=Parafrankia irregularis TaxID=795642 RepID=A0A0S4QEH5_9ACTN|nr:MULTISPECIES: response regulator [Parafrankia]CUU53889.1 Response regulator receiver domain-containing protein [Parafrankia irregularis]
MEQSATILVVDDEEPITDLVSMALRYEGYQVATASTGQAALTKVALCAPDLIVGS